MRLQEMVIQRADTQETGSRKLKYSRLCPSLLPKTQNINKQTNKFRNSKKYTRKEIIVLLFNGQNVFI